MEAILNSAFGQFLANNYSILVALHVLTMAIGLGAATITDILFFRFLKDYKLTEWEAETLNAMSKIVWTVIPLILLTGFGLFVLQYEQLSANPRFLMKVITVGVIVLNGIVLSRFIGPRMLRIFGENQTNPVPRWIRRMAFGHGSISIVSWYSAFILASFREFDYDLPVFIAIYGAMLLIAISVSQIMEVNYGKHRDGQRD